MTVSDEGVDDHGDDSTSATALSVGGAALPGDLETYNDEDWFSFAASVMVGQNLLSFSGLR